MSSVFEQCKNLQNCCGSLYRNITILSIQDSSGNQSASFEDTAVAICNKLEQQIWNGIFAEIPDAWRKAPPSIAMQSSLSWLRTTDAQDILDIGCGVGRWSVWLARQGYNVRGADFAPRATSYANKWADEERLNIPFNCLPITERTFPSQRFDVVLAALVFDLVSRLNFEKP